MNCKVCGNNSFHDEAVSETFTINSRVIVIEDIPSNICDRCGASNFSAEVAERVRRLVREPHGMARKIEAEILEYTAA